MVKSKRATIKQWIDHTFNKTHVYFQFSFNIFGATCSSLTRHVLIQVASLINLDDQYIYDTCHPLDHLAPAQHNTKIDEDV
jgi:hypothetical protein